MGLSGLFASFEEQVVCDPDVTSSYLVCVEAPAVPLEFLNCSADVVVVANLHAHVFFQFNFTFSTIKRKFTAAV